MSIWNSEADVERDMWMFSETQVDYQTLDKPLPPPTIKEYEIRMSKNSNSSIYDEKKNVKPVSKGIGRGRYMRSSDMKPRIVEEEDNELEIKRRLREVSGLGYSNELIMKSVQVHQAKPTSKEKNFEIPIRLTPVPQVSPDSSPSRQNNKTSTTQLPPPLSVMRKKKKTSEELKVTEKPLELYNIRPDSAKFNLKSNKDFPTLK